MLHITQGIAYQINVEMGEAHGTQGRGEEWVHDFRRYLKKEGTCLVENCVRSFAVTAVTLDIFSTSGRQVTVKWRKGKVPPCNFRPRSLTLQPAAEGCCDFFGNAQSFSCTNLKAALYRPQPDHTEMWLALNMTTADTGFVRRQWFTTINGLLIDYFTRFVVIFINNIVWLLLMVQFVVSSTVFCTGYMYCRGPR